jgi:putative ABC transport system permease protein
MIRFLLKGIYHDKGRSLLPVIVVSIGVMVTVIMHCWINGILGESVSMNANFTTGQVKVMTRAYAEESNQMPNDLAILGVDTLAERLRHDYPGMDWVKRIRFGALVDFPDSVGETRAQGPVIGWGIDLFSPGSKEKERFNIEKSIVQGKIPALPGEALLSSELADKFKVKPGDEFTLFGTTMDGAMAFKNFKLSGTVRFGASVIDRGAIIIDITDAQNALQMDDAAGEVLGYFKEGPYMDDKAKALAGSFNAKYSTSKDEYAPVMFSLSQQEGMADLMSYIGVVGNIMIIVFVLAMSVVLWNAGLLGGLRRFSEFGVRLALGEDKTHIYKSLIYEGILIGFIGTVAGTAIGLFFSYLLQAKGLDLSGFMKNSTLMMPSVARAIITPAAFYVGIFPGILSMVLGNALAGVRIYKRKTAQLFKELEV